MLSNQPQQQGVRLTQTQQGNLQPRRTCSKKGQVGVGVCLILASTLTIIFGIVAVALPTLYYAYGGNPLWTGVIILVSGILCTVSGKGNNKCVAIGALVMNIISIIFAADQILWMSVAAATEEYSNEHCNYYYYYYHYSYYSDDDCDAEIAIDAVLIALGVVELGFAIAAVCVLSATVCCSRQQSMPVVYQAGNPVIVQGGVVQAPMYPPQTQIVTQQGTVLIPQPGTTYPMMQTQYVAGQPQQYPVAGQPQQYPVAGLPPQQNTVGQPQQFTAGQQNLPGVPGGEAPPPINPGYPPSYTEVK